MTLIRIVWDRARGKFVASRTGPGRGAYVHSDRDCLEAAQRRRALARALRVANPPAVDLAELISPELMKRPSGERL